MLDMEDLTLHRPSHEHLVTRCGISMDHCSVGPEPFLVTRSERLCTSCFNDTNPA
jgi:hypothetical protein